MCVCAVARLSLILACVRHAVARRIPPNLLEARRRICPVVFGVVKGLQGVDICVVRC